MDNRIKVVNRSAFPQVMNELFQQNREYAICTRYFLARSQAEWRCGQHTIFTEIAIKKNAFVEMISLTHDAPHSLKMSNKQFPKTIERNDKMYVELGEWAQRSGKLNVASHNNSRKHTICIWRCV